MRALLQRVVQLFVVLLLVTMFTSLLIDLVPGDVTYSLAPVSTPQQREQLRHELHLDRPVYERYGEWVNGLAHGNLGCYYGTSGYTTSSSCPDTVADRVKDALPISLMLMFYAQLLALVIAIPLGVHVVGERRRPEHDHHVVGSELLAKASALRGEEPGERRVVLGEAAPAGQRAHPHRRPRPRPISLPKLIVKR